MSNNNSQDNPSDPIKRLHHERTVHDSPYKQLRNDNMEWLTTENENVDHIVRIERLRREYHREYGALVVACENENKRPVIAALLHNDGIGTYDDLMEYTSLRKRTIKKYVRGFREDNIMDVEDGRPATISFDTEAIAILAENYLTCLYSTEE